MKIIKDIEKRLNKGILSYEEIQAMRDSLDTKEYNSLVLKSLHYKTLWDYLTTPFWRIGYIISESWYAIKTYCYNAWKFRKALKSYRGWDFGYDLNMLLIMYEIKIKSFEIACEYIEDGPKLLAEIRSIHADLKYLVENDLIDVPDYEKVYRRVFKKMQNSINYWW